MIKDKLFLLSKTEEEKYFKDDEERVRCGWHGTGFDKDIRREEWWLRSPSKISDYVYTISEWGYNSEDLNLLTDAVCPALHLKSGFLSKLPRYGDKYVQFGKNPVTEDPLSWIILDEGTELIHAVDVLGYHKFDSETTDYEKSAIRKYINEELMPKLFTEKELSMISYTLINGEKSIRVFEKNVELPKENKEDKSISDTSISDGVKKVLKQLEARVHEPGSTIAADVGKALENIPTKDLIAYCSFKFGEAFVRNWAEHQIIADEINKVTVYNNRFTSTIRNHDTQKRKGR